MNQFPMNNHQSNTRLDTTPKSKPLFSQSNGATSLTSYSLFIMDNSMERVEMLSKQKRDLKKGMKKEHIQWYISKSCLEAIEVTKYTQTPTISYLWILYLQNTKVTSSHKGIEWYTSGWNISDFQSTWPLLGDYSTLFPGSPHKDCILTFLPDH